MFLSQALGGGWGGGEVVNSFFRFGGLLRPQTDPLGSILAGREPKPGGLSSRKGQTAQGLWRGPWMSPELLILESSLRGSLCVLWPHRKTSVGDTQSP